MNKTYQMALILVIALNTLSVLSCSKPEDKFFGLTGVFVSRDDFVKVDKRGGFNWSAHYVLNNKNKSYHEDLIKLNNLKEMTGSKHFGRLDFDFRGTHYAGKAHGGSHWIYSQKNSSKNQLDVVIVKF
jgi:hypothetical protein